MAEATIQRVWVEGGRVFAIATATETTTVTDASELLAVKGALSPPEEIAARQANRPSTVRTEEHTVHYRAEIDMEVWAAATSPAAKKAAIVAALKARRDADKALERAPTELAVTGARAGSTVTL